MRSAQSDAVRFGRLRHPARDDRPTATLSFARRHRVGAGTVVLRYGSQEAQASQADDRLPGEARQDPHDRFGTAGTGQGAPSVRGGLEQADRAAHDWPDSGPTRSPRCTHRRWRRTRDTAKPIGRALGQRVRVRKDLIEADFGEWTGRKLSELSKLPEWQRVQNYPSSLRFPGGESFAEMQQRVSGELFTRSLPSTPASGWWRSSHADPIKAAVADAMGTHLDLFQRIVIGPCSISAILFTPFGPRVLAVNSTGDDLSSLMPS